MKRKAQGLSLNTIIIAAIVLIVLVVLWAIFTGRMGKFTQDIKTQDLKTQESANKLAAMSKGNCLDIATNGCAGLKKDDLCRIDNAGACGLCSADSGACTAPTP